MEFAKDVEAEFGSVVEKHQFQVPFQALLQRREDFELSVREHTHSVFKRTISAIYDHMHKAVDYVLVFASEDNLEYAFHRVGRGALNAVQYRNCQMTEVGITFDFHEKAPRVLISLIWDDGEKNTFPYQRNGQYDS